MKINVGVFQEVEVSFDEAKFTPEFMADFRKHFYQFNTIEQHAKHLAQLYARGISGEDSFIEGYGLAKDFGIKFNIVDGDQEIIR